MALRWTRALLVALSVGALAACGDDDDDGIGPIDPGGPCDVRTAAATIGIGQTVNGTLSDRDCTLTDGSFADLYRLNVTTARSIEIDMTSASFDTYLVLYNANGTVVAEDDDSGGGVNGTNSRLAGNLPAGNYVIAANSFDVGEIGNYSLTVR